MQDFPATAILLVCHNRRDTTLRALRGIAAQVSAFPVRTILFDDASTDGTASAVRREFPATTILEGDGSAFWNGGLNQAWQRAASEPVEAFLWLNDDVELDTNAFSRLTAAWQSMRDCLGHERFILAAATRDREGNVTYGGFRRERSPFAFRLKQMPPSDELQSIDTFNGNIVLVPRAVVDCIGINDPVFHHNLGDIDYGLRARAKGVRVMLMPQTLGICEANLAKQTGGFGSPRLTLRERWRKVNSHHGLPFKSWWHLTQRHSGPWWPLHFLLPYRKLLIPKWFSAKSSVTRAANGNGSTQ